jgi:uncharacterized membrane protein
MTDVAASKPSEEGKSLGVVVYILYLLSWPTIGLLMIIGVILAYSARGGAAPWVRTHLDKEVRLFWTTLWWMIGAGVLWVAGLLLVPALGLGLLVWWGVGIMILVLAIWFHLTSLLGLIHLAQDRPAE